MGESQFFFSVFTVARRLLSTSFALRYISRKLFPIVNEKTRCHAKLLPCGAQAKRVKLTTAFLKRSLRWVSERAAFAAAGAPLAAVLASAQAACTCVRNHLLPEISNKVLHGLVPSLVISLSEPVLPPVLRYAARRKASVVLLISCALLMPTVTFFFSSAAVSVAGIPKMPFKQLGEIPIIIFLLRVVYLADWRTGMGCRLHVSLIAFRHIMTSFQHSPSRNIFPPSAGHCCRAAPPAHPQQHPESYPTGKSLRFRALSFRYGVFVTFRAVKYR